MAERTNRDMFSRSDPSSAKNGLSACHRLARILLKPAQLVERRNPFHEAIDALDGYRFVCTLRSTPQLGAVLMQLRTAYDEHVQALRIANGWCVRSSKMLGVWRRSATDPNNRRKALLLVYDDASECMRDALTHFSSVQAALDAAGAQIATLRDALAGDMRPGDVYHDRQKQRARFVAVRISAMMMGVGAVLGAFVGGLVRRLQGVWIGALCGTSLMLVPAVLVGRAREVTLMERERLDVLDSFAQLRASVSELERVELESINEIKNELTLIDQCALWVKGLSIEDGCIEMRGDQLNEPVDAFDEACIDFGKVYG